MLATPSRRRLLARIAAVATLAGVIVAPPAGAHELGLALVVPPRAGGTGAGPDVEGFRLAVDESPDVSHAPGPEAGDHLGGVDVDITVVRPRSDGDVAGDVARAVSRGARVVVLLRRPTAGRAAEQTGELLERVRSSAPLVVVAGTRASLPATRALPVVLLGDRPRARIDRARLARFERRFARRHGRRPGLAARRAYDAGRLVDRALARLGEGPFSTPAIAAAVPAADRALVGGRAELARPASAPSADGAARSDGAGDVKPVVAGSVAAGGAAVLVAWTLVARARRRHRADGR